jgi:hypothetical protein
MTPRPGEMEFTAIESVYDAETESSPGKQVHTMGSGYAWQHANALYQLEFGTRLHQEKTDYWKLEVLTSPTVSDFTLTQIDLKNRRHRDRILDFALHLDRLLILEGRDTGFQTPNFREVIDNLSSISRNRLSTWSPEDSSHENLLLREVAGDSNENT